MAAVPGSLFRRCLFWAHLACGVTAGGFILIMSVTGVLLTYEHQMVESAARGNHVTVPAGARPLPADELAGRARATAAPDARLSLVYSADPTAPVTVSRGRAGSTYLNPYTGEVIEDAAAGRRGFFRVVENWHRWMGGDSRSTRATLIDVSNLMFLFIIVSGIYLWLPRVWRWRTVRGLVLFQRRYVNAKARDFNWHHVFSVWMLIPLFLISLSGVVMSYPWANQLLFAAFGEEPPQRAAPGGGQGAGRPGGEVREAPAPGASLESVRAAAVAQVPEWNRLTLPLQAARGGFEVTVELPSTERRPPRRTVKVDANDASVVELGPVQGAAAQTPGQRARTWMRFVHTGEQYGVIGQTLAGLASLAACFLVYTGIALAWRRLIRPLFRRELVPG